MQDDEILSLLHGLTRPTFFSRDQDPGLRHSGYCLVWLDVPRSQAASYLRQLLGHPAFAAEAKRLGYVIRVSPTGIHYWHVHMPREQTLSWQLLQDR